MADKKKQKPNFVEKVSNLIGEALFPPPNFDIDDKEGFERISKEMAATEKDKKRKIADEAKDQKEFDKLVPGDFRDMGRTEAMKERASEEFGGEFPDVYAKKSEPMGNVTTVTDSPPPVGVKARFDGADILDEADIARRADVPEDTLAALFKKTHGGSFDPKSKMDKAKMATITSMIGENRDLLDLSPTQFALKVYARKK